MPYAYKRLTNQQKSSIVRIHTEAYADNVKLILSFISPLEEFDLTISYINGGSAKATVEFGNEVSPPIDLNFVDIFLEDLEMVLKYQSSVLTKFRVNCENGTVEDRKKIMKRLKIILKPITLKVKTLIFVGTTASQAMLTVEYFDPSELHRVWLFRLIDPKNFDYYLKGLSEVEVEDDGRCITFKLVNPTSRSICSKNETPVSSLNEIVSRIVFENRLPMGIILGHLQCFDIERLRKVSPRICECVDIIKPNPHIETYSIRFDVCIAAGKLRTYIKLENGEFKNVEYFTQGNQVHWSGGNSFPGTDYKSICLNDTEKTLNHQMKCIKELIICFEYQDIYIKNLSNPLDSFGAADLSRRIGDILKRREKPLKTKKFSMGSNSQMEVMEILPAIDTHSLEVIELLFPVEQESTVVRELPFQVDRLSQTDQWKNAEHLISKKMTITTPIPEMNILSFVNLDILVKTLSSEDVNYLRKNLRKSSKLQKFKISFLESTIDGSMHTLIGEPFRIVSDFKKIWYFPIEYTNDYIHIVLDTHDVKDGFGNLKPKLITFTRVAAEETPFF
ncbi:hypothetical protein B9Z55_027831 [Caenorhabditis nigoni]|uniref:DUF38 domain-containing protein n=1 Tax=Caenorhabditis nigoni TaxID=1611254 RepID=A0A2G5SEH7_9PELO|nr:hypothetical protein B9Z55_027831 [Caenorhabditis nigoni]